MKIKSIKRKTVTLQELWDSSPGEERPYLDGSIKDLRAEVLTPEGPRFTDFIYRGKATTNRVLTEETELGCTLTHELCTEQGEWVASSSLQPGAVLRTESGTTTVKAVEPFEECTVMDISVPGPRCYYANGILSHNSAIIGQLAKNQAELGYKVNVVPLEMSHIELLARYVANLTGINTTNVLLKRLAQGEKEEAFRLWRRFDRRVEKKGGRLTIFKPNEDLTIEAIMAAIHSYNADITYIDYISLLKGADGDDQWRQLGAIGRYGKVYAESHKKVMTLAAQVNDEGKLRYSKAIGEHCVVPATWVNFDGRLMKAGEAITRAHTDAQLTTSLGDRTVQAYHAFGKKKTLRLTTQLGFEVEVSATTPVLVLRSGLRFGWVKASAIEKGDCLVISRKSSWPKIDPLVEFNPGLLYAKSEHLGPKPKKTPRFPHRMSPALGRVLGYLAAEGHITPRGSNVGIVNKDRRLCDDYCKLFNRLFGTSIAPRWSAASGVYHCTYNAADLHQFFAVLGAHGTSRTKEVPWVVLQGTRRTAKEFLRGYFEGDGWRTEGGACCTTYSRELAEQLQLLLLKFGIVAGRRQSNDGLHHLPSRTSKEQGDHWGLTMTGSEGRRFLKEIGFLSQRKNRAAPSRETKWASKTEYLPGYKEAFASYKVGHNGFVDEKGTRHINAKFWQALGAGTSCASPRISKLRSVGALPFVKKYFPSRYATLADIFSMDAAFNEVTAITEGASEVVDFTVEEGANGILAEGHFVANGLAVHNSSTAFSFVATKESREKGYINVGMFKARNQTMMDFTLGVDYSSMRIYDLSPEELETKTADSKKAGKESSGTGSGKKSKNQDYLPDLTE